MSKSKNLNFYEAGQDFVEKQIKSNPQVTLDVQGDAIVSFHPSDFLWGYTYHSHCVPPFKPDSVLILGYGKGQIADLIRKIHGADVKITGVDLVKQHYRYTEYKMHIMDAHQFVKDCTSSIIKKRYDYIVIDLFDGEKVPDFVFETEFAVRLKQMTKRLVCLNTLASDFERLKPYADYSLKFHRFVPIFGNAVSFWGV